jgi:class 3 adenylate cyclase
VLAVFDGPARAIRCARAINRAANEAGLALKIGLHTGECDVTSGVAGGIVAEIAVRVAASGRLGEVLVSRTVVDLVAGSGLRFADRGTHRVAPGAQEWRLFAVRPDDEVTHLHLLRPTVGSG